MTETAVKPPETGAVPAPGEFDYSRVSTAARVVLYDDPKAIPRVTKVEPAATVEYIERLADVIDDQAKRAGGKIPYMVVREVSENFIHAQFREVVVSILDNGDTIRFADQGPGIADKEKAQRPGFTTAIEPMKDIIRGVGSGLPTVREWLEVSDGSLVIEDNIDAGTVVTISLVKRPAPTPAAAGIAAAQPAALPKIPLTDREQEFLRLLASEDELRVTDLMNLTGIGNSSVMNTLRKLEENALAEKLPNKKRTLTDLGRQVAMSL